MDSIFSIQNISVSAIFSLSMACMYLIASLKMAGAMQQSGYSGKRFRKWYYKKENLLKSRHVLLALLILFSSALLGMCFIPIGVNWAYYASCVPFYLFTLIFIFADGKYALKVPTKYTPRLKRLCVTYTLIMAIFLYIIVTLLNVAAYYIDIDVVSSVRLFPVAISALLLPHLLAFSNLICSPFEKAYLKGFIKKAKKKIAESGAVKIAITGSYAKTSVKNILSTILSEKYKVAYTPYSYNTPAGIARFINDGGADGAEVIIFEMGARKKGDISELCDIISPDYSILTGVAPQHMETFKSLEEIIAEKSVALSRAKCGIVTVNIEGVSAAVKSSQAKKKAVIGKDILIKSVEVTEKGTSFTIGGSDGDISSETKLLSAHSACNIALCYAAAQMLNMSDSEILRGIAKIEYVPHRLQKIESGGIVILDDSYNSNVVGAKDSIGVLRLFGGKKYVVTPGLVEMGMLERSANEQLGKELVGLDKVILVGETLVKVVAEGYTAAGGDKDKMVIVPTVDDAKKLIGEELSDGDCVLFLNDLPDVY